MTGPVRVAAACIAAGALTGSLVFSLLWLLRADSYWFVLITSYTPYALPGYLMALAALLVFRSGLAAPLRGWVTGACLIAASGAVLHAALLAPLFLGDHPERTADLTVLTLSTRRGGAEPAAVVKQVKAEYAQVVVLEEVTPELRQRLLENGLDQVLPHVGGAPGAGASGTMIFSAYPLTESAEVPLGHGSYRIKVAAPEPFWLVAVHLSQPLNGQGSAWRGDWSVLNQVVAAIAGPVILAGDFNSTLDHRPMRTLLGRGFADAARQSNAGWQPTYPNRWGLLAIDHVVSRGAYDAVSTETLTVPGTDHRALVARFAVSPTK